MGDGDVANAERSYRGLLAALRSSLIVVDDTTHVQWASADAAEMLGGDAEGLVGHSISRWLAVDDAAWLAAALVDQQRGLVAHGEPLTWICQIRREDGTSAAATLEVLPPSGDDGLHHILLKRPEPEALGDRQRQGRHQDQAWRHAALVIGPAGEIHGWDSMLDEMVGRGADDPEPEHLDELLAAGESERLALTTRLEAMAGRPLEFTARLQAEDGLPVSANVRITNLSEGEPPLFMVVLDRLQVASARLNHERQRRSQLEALVLSSPTAACAVDAQHIIRVHNTALARLVGGEEDRLQARPFERLFVPQLASQVGTWLRSWRTGVGDIAPTMEAELQDAGGTAIPIRLRIEVAFADGLPIHAIHVEDLRPVLRERALREHADEHLARLYQELPVPFILIDAEDRIARVSHEAETLLGRDAADLVGHQWFTLVAPERHTQARTVADVVRRTGTMPEGYGNLLLGLHPSEARIPLDWTVIRLEDGGLLATFEDRRPELEVEAAQEEFNAHLARLMNLRRDAFLLLDLDHRIRAWNGVAVAGLGARGTELRYLSIYRFVLAGQHNRLKTWLNQVEASDPFGEVGSHLRLGMRDIHALHHQPALVKGGVTFLRGEALIALSIEFVSELAESAADPRASLAAAVPEEE